jgi:hypothetical protein
MKKRPDQRWVLALDTRLISLRRRDTEVPVKFWWVLTKEAKQWRRRREVLIDLVLRVWNKELGVNSGVKKFSGSPTVCPWYVHLNFRIELGLSFGLMTQYNVIHFDPADVQPIKSMDHRIH